KVVTKNKPIINKQSAQPTLTIAGSVSEVTREQIAYQEEQGAYVLSIHPIQLLKNHEAALLEALEKAKEILSVGKDLVVTTLLTKEAKDAVEQFARESSMEKLELGNRIASMFGQFASQLIKEVEVSGLILTGGDIAYQTCLQLGIDSLEVVEEIEEGIPLCRVMTGTFRNTAIVTKAGAFGHRSSLHHAMNVIKQT
ncbi:nucleotide-binding domain containing protein, partial [Halalkalibacterium ligniniphilum]